MKGTLVQHIVNTIQILFGGLLIFMYVGKISIIENIEIFDNQKYVLLVLAVIFGLCIFAKGRLKKKYNIKDPLVESKAAKWLIYSSYLLFFLFLFVLTVDKNFSRLAGGLAWLTQIIALIISFFYVQETNEGNDEILDDQMMNDGI